jgi:hypothetical protein
MRRVFVVVIACTALLGGCAEIRVRQAPVHESVLQKVTINQKFLLFGAVRLNPPIRLDEACPQGWESFKTWTTTGQALLRVVTLNLYSSWKTEVSCSESRRPPQNTAH